MPFSDRDETKQLNELLSKERRGAFVQLCGDVTHYELSNPEQGDSLILVHGFAVPDYIFDPTFEFLTAARILNAAANVRREQYLTGESFPNAGLRGPLLYALASVPSSK